MNLVSRRLSEASPARIGALSVLPVFLDLTGRRVVVAGGTDAAAWKAELVAAAGAAVDIYAGDAPASATMQALVERETAIRLIPEPWSLVSLRGAAIALGDFTTEGEAWAFRCAAKAAGVSSNVIDKPAFCDFQFGTIVNRSPVVVGISTTGAAPILGQAVRRRVETLLSPSLATWGALAARIRSTVNDRLAPGALRRRFWEAFVDRAFGTAPTDADEAALLGSLDDGPASDISAGCVTFVGAGPGDAELLTLKAVRALQSADIILFDDLVSDDVLELARREARRILVGKRAGRPSCRQDDINTMMISLAKSGRRVVRLKSGDPMIFGRAGEEMAALEREGIAYDIVPGITAGLALAATLGVSLTHRDLAKSVRFVTGHSKHGGLPDDVDWTSIADRSATTIFYMGVRTAPQIAVRLIAEGMDAATPVVFAANLGRADAQTVHSTLEAVASAPAPELGLGPVVIGIGTVFGLSSAAAVAHPALAATG